MAHPLVARLDAALAKNYPAVYEVLGAGSSQDDLDELERVFGMPLPELYRDFLAWRGPLAWGVYPRAEYLISYYELTTARQAIETVEMLRELREVETGWREAVWWGEFYLPLMRHGGPELVIDIAGEALVENEFRSTEAYPSVPGQVLEFHHADELRPIHAPSLDVWMTAFALTCERGLFGVRVMDLNRGPVIDLTDDNESFEAVLGELAPGFPLLPAMLHDTDDFA